MKQLVQMIVAIVFLAGMAACAPATPVTQAPAATTEPSGAQGDHPLSTRTGLDEIDSILDAVASGDAQELRSLVQFTNTKCTLADGLGGPPKCLEGQVEGTPLEVLPFLGSEGSFILKEDIGDWPGIDVSGLYAIYEVSAEAYNDRDYPAGQYAIVFLGKESEPPIALRVTDGRIVRVDYVLVNSLADLRSRLEPEVEKFILAPVGQ